MEKIDNEQFLEEIWDDADFKTSKNQYYLVKHLKRIELEN